MASPINDFAQRSRLLEERIVDPRSTISVDSLLDSVVALIYDCEGLKKTKNFDAFYNKCKNKRKMKRNSQQIFTSFSSCIHA